MFGGEWRGGEGRGGEGRGGEGRGGREGGGREGRGGEGGMTVIHILIGMFNSNPLSGLLLTCRHHFVQRPHAQCNSIVCARVTSRLRGNAMGQCTCACVMAERRCSAHADVEQSDGGTLTARKPRDKTRQALTFKTANIYVITSGENRYNSRVAIGWKAEAIGPTGRLSNADGDGL